MKRILAMCNDALLRRRHRRGRPVQDDLLQRLRAAGL